MKLNTSQLDRLVVSVTTQTPLNNAGTLDFPYPYGYGKGNFDLDRTSQLIDENGSKFFSGEDFTVAYGATDITITWTAPTGIIDAQRKLSLLLSADNVFDAEMGLGFDGMYSLKGMSTMQTFTYGVLHPQAATKMGEFTFGDTLSPTLELESAQLNAAYVLTLAGNIDEAALAAVKVIVKGIDLYGTEIAEEISLTATMNATPITTNKAFNFNFKRGGF